MIAKSRSSSWFSASRVNFSSCGSPDHFSSSTCASPFLRRDKATFAKPEYERWWQCWEEEGWLSLGRTRNFDWMHVQAAKL